MAKENVSKKRAILTNDSLVYCHEAPKESIQVDDIALVPYGEIKVLVGRLMLTDKTGKISKFGTFKNVKKLKTIFCERIQGAGVSISVYLVRTPENIRIVNSSVSCGDIVCLEGSKMFYQGHDVFIAERIFVLSKAVKSVHDQNISFKTKSDKYFNRYIQMIRNPKIVSHLRKCSSVTRIIREILQSRGFEEFNLTLLQKTFEGGLSRPFVTKSTDHNQTLYLRLTSELLMWRLMIAGFTKVYEIGKSFRNQVSTACMLPQFTLLELYQAYVKQEEIELLAKEIIYKVIDGLSGKMSVIGSNGEIDCSGDWPVYNFKEEVNKYSGLEYDEAKSDTELLKIVDKCGAIRPQEINKCSIATTLYYFIVSKIKGPAFLRNMPAAQSPLYKLNQDGSTIEETLLVIDGKLIAVITNPERNPDILKKRMEEQLVYRNFEQGNKLNVEILEALKYGMPPCRGLAIGIEHLLMLLLNVTNIREVEVFPIF